MIKNQPKEDKYCYCSESTFCQIRDKQLANPLSTNEVIQKYTRCLDGCGSCIEDLEIFLTENSAIVEDV